MPEISWGLDLSTTPKKSAATAIEWTDGCARVVEVVTPLRGESIAPLIAEHKDHQWAVDVPFGWPERFVALMHDRQTGPLQADLVPEKADWSLWRTREVAQRRTDAFLTNESSIRTRPLPAAFQLLGATAAMWCLVEADLAAFGIAVDRSGTQGKVCETYPAATLAYWKSSKGKHTWPMLQELLPGLTADQGLVHLFASDDVCDAILCAVAARARSLRKTHTPSPEDLPDAQREGWIHIPNAPWAELLVSAS